MPMGGPVYQAALGALDAMHVHGLFKGRQEGHMLGTAFFPALTWSYTFHSPEGKVTEPARNCLWVRALRNLPSPEIDPGSTLASSGNAEKGIPGVRTRARA